MRRLHGADLFHLTREAGGLPAHTVKVAVLAPGDGPLDPDAVADWLMAHLAGRAPFRWRLEPTPLRLGRPVWVDAEAISAGHHLNRRSLTGPDRDRALQDLVGELAGGPPLSRDRPLWRVWVVDGLPDGRVAVALQLHHALADGAASVRIWEETFGDAPPPPVIAAPGRGARLQDAVRHHARAVRTLPSFIRRLRASDARRKQVPPGGTSPTNHFEAPAVSFNGPLSTQRTCRFVTVPLADLRATARRLGGTVNDVFCAVCSGAVRAYLLERGELPDEPLTATAPVALERDGPGYGNVMTSWFWSLATDETDVLTRFRVIRASLQAARDLQEADPALLYDLQEHRGLYEASWRFLSRAERRHGRPMLNLITSNVRGPEPLAWQGHPVVDLWSVGPLTGRMGLNLTAWSYDEAFTIGLHADRHLVPDLDRLTAVVAAEVGVLRDAVDHHTEPGSAA